MSISHRHTCWFLIWKSLKFGFTHVLNQLCDPSASSLARNLNEFDASWNESSLKCARCFRQVSKLPRTVLYKEESLLLGSCDQKGTHFCLPRHSSARNRSISRSTWTGAAPLIWDHRRARVTWFGGRFQLTIIIIEQVFSAFCTRFFVFIKG